MKALIPLVIALISSTAFATPVKGQPNYFSNCKALNKVYPQGVPKSHPAYRPALDRNENKWACDPKPR